jgi:hypothetical protein
MDTSLNRLQGLTMPRLNTEQTYVLRIYKVSSGDLMCAVTEVATGQRWVAHVTPDLERLLRHAGHDGTSRPEKPGLESV